MGSEDEVVIVRLGHRPGRDDRMTTHVGLTARALGARRFILIGNDSGPIDRIDDVTGRFGGPFKTEHRSAPDRLLEDWDGPIVHLTMYGLPVGEVVGQIGEEWNRRSGDLAVVVGAEKVPFSVYEVADWNVAVTNQPHSEVASLAVFLDRLSGGTALDCDFVGGTHRVVPSEAGKRVDPAGAE